MILVNGMLTVEYKHGHYVLEFNEYTIKVQCVDYWNNSIVKSLDFSNDISTTLETEDYIIDFHMNIKETIKKLSDIFGYSISKPTNDLKFTLEDQIANSNNITNFLNTQTNNGFPGDLTQTGRVFKLNPVYTDIPFIKEKEEDFNDY